MTKIQEIVVKETPSRPICLTLNHFSVGDQNSMKLYQKNQDFYPAMIANKKLYANKLKKEDSRFIGIRSKKNNTLRIFVLDGALLTPEEIKDTNCSTVFSPDCLAPLDMKTGIVYSVNSLVPQQLIDNLTINKKVKLYQFTENLLNSTTITDENKKIRFQKLVYYLNYLIEFAINFDSTEGKVLCPHSQEVNKYFVNTFTYGLQKNMKSNSSYCHKLYACIIMLSMILGDFKVDLDKLLELLPIHKGFGLTKKGIINTFKFQSRGSYAIELKYPLRTVFTKLTYCNISK